MNVDIKNVGSGQIMNMGALHYHTLRSVVCVFPSLALRTSSTVQISGVALLPWLQ